MKRASTIDKVALGKRIKAERIAKKLTRERLAEQVGLSETFIKTLENGTASPSLSTVTDIANALSTSVDYFLCDSLTLGHRVITSKYTEEINNLPANERERIYDVLDALLKHTKR